MVWANSGDTVRIHHSAKLTDAMVMLDGNHPLTGQDLAFDIELVEIVIA